MTELLVVRALAILVLVAACGVEDRPPEDHYPDLLGGGELDGLPTGTAQWKQVCATGYTDAVTRKFCSGKEPPRITSLEQLQVFLALDPRNRNTVSAVMTASRQASASAV